MLDNDMADVFTPEQRHIAMQHMRSKDTVIELVLRKALWEKGIRYRKNYRKLPGTPDIAITKYKIAIFCDGEFFHGKDWEKLELKLEKGHNGSFWIKKIQNNINRDQIIDKTLEQQGWLVIRFWGNDIKKNLSSCVDVVCNAIDQVAARTKGSLR